MLSPPPYNQLPPFLAPVSLLVVSLGTGSRYFDTPCRMQKLEFVRRTRSSIFHTDTDMIGNDDVCIRATSMILTTPPRDREAFFAMINQARLGLVCGTC